MMEQTHTGCCAALAEALRYPTPARRDALDAALAQIPPGKARQLLDSFLIRLEGLSLGEWEELYTRTWDIDPPAAPYVGFQLWGDDYRRGKLMARLRQVYWEKGIETDGELPDHLLPVLRYVDQAQTPNPRLVEALLQATEKMRAALREHEPGNPYLFVLEAISAAIEGLR